MAAAAPELRTKALAVRRRPIGLRDANRHRLWMDRLDLHVRIGGQETIEQRLVTAILQKPDVQAAISKLQKIAAGVP